MVKDRGSWGGSKRKSALVLLVAVAIAITALIPAASFMRATTYDPSLHVPGQESLQNRIRRVQTALDVIVTNPIVGVGIGNFRWVYRTFYGMGGESHNSYLWAATSGGLGTLALYLCLFYVTHLMLARLERSGTPQLLWVRKALRANFVVFLVFSAFADFWLSEYLYLIVGMTIAMTYLDRRMSGGPLRHRPPLVPDGAVARIAQA
jgi:O-antigen ligase